MRKILAFGVILVLVFVSGCNFEKLSPMEEVQKKLLEMENYKCEAALTRVSNKGEENYDISQYYKNTGQYRLEILSPESIAGNYTVYDGEKIYQYNKMLNSSVISDITGEDHNNELFLGCFIKNYMDSEGVSLEAGSFDTSDCIILEANIPGGNRYLSSEKLWIDESTLKPVRFVIYDIDGNERYILTYTQFEYNAQLDDSLFIVN